MFMQQALFLETDFTTAEEIHLNRVAVPCVSYLTSHSASLPSPYLDSLPSFLSPEDDHILPPIRTYTKMSPTSLAATPTPVLAQSPTSLQIPALHV
jgi:hypothetical protein